ncbi:hypothetical protein, partial [Clostridium sp. ZBS13]|uniref:hypothetical protein n=1 Tax=Clostridium sp. ZBS13 TaxID=2949971 RepID=UPI002079E0C1
IHQNIILVSQKPTEHLRCHYFSIKDDPFNGKIEAALLNRDIMTAKNLLKTRPGEFASRKAHLIRLCSDTSTDVFNILEEFLSIIGN